jgi:hypothetical protein
MEAAAVTAGDASRDDNSGFARLTGDAPLRRRLGDAARVPMEREFSGEACLEHYTELVSSALAQRRT